MKKDCKKCVWYADCPSEFPCEYYSPIDETEVSEEYYQKVLGENNDEYKEVIKEYI